MSIRFVLPFLALLLCGPATAQQKPKPLSVIDPHIPGIRILTPSDAEFAAADPAKPDDTDLVIKNESAQPIVGIGVTYHFGKSGEDFVLDGVDTVINVPPAGTIVAGTNFMKASNNPDTVTIDLNGRVATEAEVAFLVFGDGTFWGPDRWAKQLSEKAAAQKQFYAELLRATDREQFVKTQTECAKDEACRAKSGISSQDWYYRSLAIGAYRALSQLQLGDVYWRLYPTMPARFPTIKTVNHIRSELVEPDAFGWSTYSAGGSCASGANGYGVTYNNGGCLYPSDSIPSNPPTGALNVPIPGGFWARYEASCVYNPGYPSIVPSNWIHDEFSTLVPLPGSNPAQIEYMPRENVFVEITSNLGGYASDTWTMQKLAGIVEPYNVETANQDLGKTTCYASWQSGSSPFKITQLDILSSTGPAGTGTLYSTGSFGITFYSGDRDAPNYYGYVVANRITSKYCNPTQNPTNSTFPNTALAGPAGSREWSWCNHTPPAPMANNQCNPLQDYCCCVASGGGLIFCAQQTGCFDPDDESLESCGNGCSTGGGTVEAVALSYENSQGTPPPPIGVNLNPTVQHSKIGIWSGGAFLTDNAGLGYWAGVPLDGFVTSFVPPGGLLPGDIPVVGDWTGTGQTKFGYYRPSTADWWLDWNGNGTWDDQTGGDVHYVFGYDDGAVPVVGDWQGGGQDCIGLFRNEGGTMTFILDAWCNGMLGPQNVHFQFGLPGDTPVVGKWSGIAQSQVGVVRTVGNNLEWILDWAAGDDPSQADHFPGQGFGCGLSGWQSNAICLTPAPFFFGLASDVPVVGNWLGSVSAYTGQPVSFGGVYRPSYGAFIVDSDGTQLHPTSYWWGGGPEIPIIGIW